MNNQKAIKRELKKSFKFSFNLLIIVLFFVVQNHSYCTVFQPDSTESIIELEINGLLVDETQSKTAKEFYDLFYTNWEAPSIDLQYSIIFSEKPMPRFGTLITVSINEQVVFSKFVQPRYEKIEEMSEEALQLTLSYLDNYAQIQAELKFDEMQGNGIY